MFVGDSSSLGALRLAACRHAPSPIDQTIPDRLGRFGGTPLGQVKYEPIWECSHLLILIHTHMYIYMHVYIYLSI